MTALPQPRTPDATVESDREAVWAAKALAARGLMEVSGPPLIVHVWGGDHCVRAETDGLPGEPICNAWLAVQAREWKARLITVDANLVQSVCERTDCTPQQLAASMARVAEDSGAEVVLLDEMTPRPAPTSLPKPAPIGEAVFGAPGFAVGHVRELPPAVLPGLSDMLARLGRDATFVSNGPGQDRMTASRQGTGNHHLTWIDRAGRHDESAQSWLSGVVLAYEPRLLIVESLAVDRGELDLEAIAVEHHVAVGVLPAPIDPLRTNSGHITPESLEAQNGKH